MCPSRMWPALRKFWNRLQICSSRPCMAHDGNRQEHDGMCIGTNVLVVWVSGVCGRQLVPLVWRPVLDKNHEKKSIYEKLWKVVNRCEFLWNVMNHIITAFHRNFIEVHSIKQLFWIISGECFVSMSTILCSWGTHLPHFGACALLWQVGIYIYIYFDSHSQPFIVKSVKS